jgi:hypothetical protein
MLGIVANPASGKDVRRLVARASVFDNQEKQAIVRRALAGARAAGLPRVVYMDDAHGITRGALDEAGIPAEPLDTTRTGTALDTITAARAMREAGCRAVLVLGGDGTNRAFCLGWPDAPLVPVSTGTNNVFPRLVEATVAGAAAALVACGELTLAQVARRQKMLSVTIEGEDGDLALIDAVLTRDRFIGARALLDPDALALAVLTRADPAAVGITAIGGLLQPVGADDPGGLVVRFGPGTAVEAPIAPGWYRTIEVARVDALAAGASVAVSGPGVLAFDGERERPLAPGQRASVTLTNQGPWVVDVGHALQLAAARGLFRRPITSCAHPEGAADAG